MKKFCTIGIVTGVVLVILGVVMLGLSAKVVYRAYDSSFGGDFYTYQYRATVRIGETIEFIGSSAFLAGGIGTIAFGILVICYFGCKLQSVSELLKYEPDKVGTSSWEMSRYENTNTISNKEIQRNETMGREASADEHTQKLQSLYNNGLISKEEYEARLK